MAEAAAKKKKSGNRITRFFKEVKSEMKKVVWPTKKQVIKNTLIVIAVVLLIGIVIWALDFGFGLGIDKLVGK
ncbi:MAG: preprotein translocase subunit SecE [Clostridia bacterium]|nr:preprotein translocase subunit SecE [Clostridia bacterium]